MRANYQQIGNWEVGVRRLLHRRGRRGGAQRRRDRPDRGHQPVPPAGSAVGQYILVRNIPTIVVGVLAPKGSGFGGDQDDAVFVPFNMARVRLFGATTLNSISIQAESAEVMPQVTTDITNLLRTAPPPPGQPAERLQHPQQQQPGRDGRPASRRR